MVLVFVFIITSAACYAPVFSQPYDGYKGANASVNAYASSTGGEGNGSRSSYSYSYSYASNGNDGAGECTYDSCTPTCSLPSPQNCPPFTNPCNCPPGSIVSEKGGKCVQRTQCQKYSNCEGDYNATYTECPITCPSTCARPNAQYCNATCAPPGCECNIGYLLSSINGKCIKPEDCPGGKVCGENENFVSCLVECPDLYCQVDENLVACGIARPCPSACKCKQNYLRKSVDDHTCILVSECPPGKCSRPNEEWNNSISRCVSDSCEVRNKTAIPEDCPFSSEEYVQGCLCKNGFFRNERNTCVPVEECPSDTE